ncbi:MAG: guanylate kinase [Holophaga sp.]|nr:guanylate kinase [Holophaga sp.]
MSQTGSIFVLSAPSGAGKSTLAKRLVAEMPGLIFSTSFTTRAPRPGEQHGREYFFVDNTAFDQMVAEDGLLEWVQVYANRYGTGKAWLREQVAQGLDVLLDIETVGAMNVKAALPEAVMIFLLPPSAEVLAKRLRGRGDTDESQIMLRMAHARHEVEQYSHYDHLVVNDDLEVAYRTLESVVVAERSRKSRMESAAQRILQTFNS